MNKETLRIGCHLSASKGFLQMGKDAVAIGANTFQFFTRNPRGGKAKNINDEDVKNFLSFSKQHDIKNIVAHAPYTLNACAAEDRILEFARETMKDDLNRMQYVPGNFYNFHPGSHVGQGVDVGIEKISDLLNEIITNDQETTVLLETMAGKGSEIGKSFEQIKTIIDKVELKNKIGVCLDTCHVYDAGYDIVNDLDNVLSQFDKIIGLDKLFVIHLNDSMNPFSSHKDRHQKLGQGSIGLNAMINIIKHPSLRNLTFILETPNDLQGYAYEIKLIKENLIKSDSST